MSAAKNCSSCSQQVGKLNDGTWIFYKEVGISHKGSKASVEYNCVKCVDSEYHKWLCLPCGTIYNKEEEFYDAEGYSICMKCIINKNSTNKNV